MATFKELTKSLWKNIKYAAKDTVDVSMFVIFLILAIIDLWGGNVRGAVGFALVYIFFLKIRLAIFEQALKNKDE